MMVSVLLAENSGGGIRIGIKGKKAVVWARVGNGKGVLTGFGSLLDGKEEKKAGTWRVIN